MNELRRRSSWGGFVVSADWPLVAIPGLIWGASFLFIAEGLKAIGPNGITFLRLFIGLATLALFPAARKPVEWSAWPGVALVGVLWFAFPLSMFPFAEQRVSSALTGMLNAVVPLATAIVATAIAGKVPERRVITGLTLGLMGAGLVAWPTVHEGHSSVVGVSLILAAVISYGFALNLARPLQQQYGALPLILRAQVVAVVLTAPLGVPDVLAARWTLVPFFSSDVGSIRDRNRFRCAGYGRRKSRGHACIVRGVLDSSGRAPTRGPGAGRVCCAPLDHRQRSLRGWCVAYAPRANRPRT